MTDLQSPPVNPFAVGGAISDPSGHGFFGRENVFGFVRSTLDATQRPPILLFGQRRIGKSSILRQLSRHLTTGLVCVFFDLQGKAAMTLDQILYGLAREIADQLDLPSPTREEATEETFARAFMPRAIQKLSNPRQLVLLFDEFDVIDQTIGGTDIAAKRFIPYLGQLLTTQNQVGVIMVVGRKTEELSESFISALVKDSVQMRIGRLSHDDVMRLINELVAGAASLTDAAAERIYALTTGHPFCTQMLCHTVWKRHQDFTRPIVAPEIDEAIPDAVELGTNGMNWIYDGLVTPEQRLLLSALSEAVEPRAGAQATLGDVQRFLREKGLTVDASQLTNAVRDLRLWDVVESADGDHFRFVVPLIGEWVRAERPVALLEQEVRFANPRAWKFYELALDNQQHYHFDAAIEDFRRALEANPVFVDAQRGLAAALKKRGHREDIVAAVEAWERVHDLDPQMAPTDLLDALMRALEIVTTPDAVRARFERIIKLDVEGLIRERAYRNVASRAARAMENGGRAAIEAAVTYYTLIGDKSGRDSALQVRASQRRYLAYGAVGSLLIFLAAIAAIVEGNPLGIDRAYAHGASIVLAAMGATLASWIAITEKDGKLPPRAMGIPFLIAGIIVGMLIWYFFQTPGWGALAAFFISSVNNSLSPTVPPLETRSTDEPGGVFRSLVARALDSLASSILRLRERIGRDSSSGTKPPQ